MPKFGRTLLPRLLPLRSARQFPPGLVIPLSSGLRLVQENDIEDPGEENDANANPPGDLPRFFSWVHSGPQMDWICATPPFACAGVREGLNSKTFKCSGLTTCFRPAKSIMPEPGARWSRPGNSTSCTWKP